MPRNLRHDPQGGLHHVMNRGVARGNLFTDDLDRRAFLALVAEANRKTGVGVGAYCLMGNHFHLLLSCAEGGLSAFMQTLGGKYARRFNDRHARDGSLFRGRFTSKLVLDDAYLAHLLVYIHRNPVDIGIDPRTWRWSSLGAFVEDRPVPRWMRVRELRPYLGTAEAHLEAVMSTPVLAGNDPVFLFDHWQSRLGTSLLHRFDAELERCAHDLSRRESRLALLLAADECGVDPDAIRAHLALPSGNALRARRSRARREVLGNSRIAAAFEALVAVATPTSAAA